jgi:hypothetical protein
MTASIYERGIHFLQNRDRRLQKKADLIGLSELQELRDPVLNPVSRKIVSDMDQSSQIQHRKYQKVKARLDQLRL